MQQVRAWHNGYRPDAPDALHRHALPADPPPQWPPVAVSHGPVLSPVEVEQAHLDAAYTEVRRMLERAERLDLSHTGGRLREAAERGRAERVELLQRTLERPEELPLMLGALRTTEGTLRVGRTLVVNEARDILVASWRAPASAAFYRATAHQPRGVLVRRRIVTHGREVRDVVDETLARKEPGRLGPVPTGESQPTVVDALLDAIERQRTGRMSDIISTLMPDQYELVAAAPDTSLFVQGAPGSGKSAVGLHRAAFLLYGDDRASGLRPSDLWVIGPNPLFLDYIRDVLPDLGEEDVPQWTLTSLLPVPPTVDEPQPTRAELLSELRMAPLLAAALDAVPTRPHEDLRSPGLHLPVSVLRKHFDGARRQPGSYIDRREAFLAAVERAAERRTDFLDRPDLRRLLSERFWPTVDPQRLVESWLTGLDPVGDAVHEGLEPSEASLLCQRPSRRGWTREEAVLIDEVHELVHGRSSQRARHLVVDEVQQLTPMELRRLRRRTTKDAAFTGLGDLAQATRPGAVTSWEDVVEILAPTGPWEPLELGTAYRTPATALRAAVALVPYLDVDVSPPVAFRQGDEPVAFEPTTDLRRALDRTVQEVAAKGGSVGVICPTVGSAEASAVRRLLRAAGHLRSDSDVNFDEPVRVLDVGSVHGLEFDHAVVVEPADIVGTDGSRGLRRLYVALTRCTRSLTIVHHLPLPAQLVKATARS